MLSPQISCTLQVQTNMSVYLPTPKPLYVFLSERFALSNSIVLQDVSHPMEKVLQAPVVVVVRWSICTVLTMRLNLDIFLSQRAALGDPEANRGWPLVKETFQVSARQVGCRPNRDTL